MNRNDAIMIASSLSESHGLQLRAKYRLTDKGPMIVLSPEDLIPAYGFIVLITIRWKRISIEFRPGNLARDLLKSMSDANADSHSIFKSLVKRIKELGATLQMSINDDNINPDDTDQWPSNWNNVSLSLHSPFIDTDGDLAKDAIGIEETLRWSRLFLILLLCLLPVEEIEQEDKYLNAEAEGNKERISVNRYERSRVNRLACIELKGTTCILCGFNFGEKYGNAGDGFIVIHHVIPISSIGNNHVINPEKDLVPVCANCHAIIHRKDPPYSTESMQVMISTKEKT